MIAKAMVFPFTGFDSSARDLILTTHDESIARYRTTSDDEHHRLPPPLIDTTPCPIACTGVRFADSAGRRPCAGCAWSSRPFLGA